MGRFGKNKNDIKAMPCPFCSNGTMFPDEEGIGYKCSDCGFSVLNDVYFTSYYNPYFDLDTIGDESYEKVYDDWNLEVICPNFYCKGKIGFKDGQYICTKCGDTISRADFFNFTGLTPIGSECLTCDQCFPNCLICPYGYKE